jgi:hypothetical protein
MEMFVLHNTTAIHRICQHEDKLLERKTTAPIRRGKRFIDALRYTGTTTDYTPVEPCCIKLSIHTTFFFQQPQRGYSTVVALLALMRITARPVYVHRWESVQRRSRVVEWSGSEAQICCHD